jgi:hypothetical protein
MALHGLSQGDIWKRDLRRHDCFPPGRGRVAEVLGSSKESQNGSIFLDSDAPSTNIVSSGPAVTMVCVAIPCVRILSAMSRNPAPSG